MEYLQKMFTTCKMNMLKSITQINCYLDEHKTNYNLKNLKNLSIKPISTKLFTAYCDKKEYLSNNWKFHNMTDRFNKLFSINIIRKHIKPVDQTENQIPSDNADNTVNAVHADNPDNTVNAVLADNTVHADNSEQAVHAEHAIISDKNTYIDKLVLIYQNSMNRLTNICVKLLSYYNNTVHPIIIDNYQLCMNNPMYNYVFIKYIVCYFMVISILFIRFSRKTI